ncbi:hypothetical protein AURANDRAFT_72685 [Aureococcus anophagefferens]|uniref:AAA+ ATPase domain-containing protein n=1 Tax=Aureococcus anophagefferens TaxID=44056 RepID=F0YMJ5_AURAN|nr:hypothetical protein AURANDRAFT_72685 [Aureococcus anophagefferens]EGB03635.1 hypothetical protein AURANDRAFT_72685 [Aureococcus anophagefferens]|eukprot:XP_009041637.1 hypothetical protein AURANDRAFT_72685 [Aureococcus anophagefferens]
MNSRSLRPHETDFPELDLREGFMMRQPAPSCPPGLETIGASVVGTCRAAFAERGAVVRGCVVLGGRGTGKTALAAWIISELGVAGEWNTGPVTTRRAVGAFERSLALRFEAARRKAPCVLVLDCFDDIAPAGSSGELDRRGAAVRRQLDALGGAHMSRVFVLALSICREGDAALADGLCRGASRLGVVYRIGALDFGARRACLEAAAARLDVGRDRAGTFAVVARRCRGFTLADIWALVAEAVRGAEGGRVSRAALITAACAGPRSRDAAAVPGASWISPCEATATANTSSSPSMVTCPLAGVAATRTYGVARRAVLEPLLVEDNDIGGLGKSALARALASEAAALGIAALDVRCNDLLQSKLGASEKAVSRIFAHARDHAPCVVLLDQVDMLGVPRGNDTTTEGSLDRILGMLLMEMDDEALLRPGRLGTRLKLEFPDVADRRAILTNKAETMPFNAAARCFLDVVADETSGLSGADLHALCHSAARCCLREHVQLTEKANPQHVAKETDPQPQDNAAECRELKVPVMLCLQQGVSGGVEVPFEAQAAVLRSLLMCKV